MPLAYAVATAGNPKSRIPESACAISVGSALVVAKKAEMEVPNEDALFLFDDGRRAVHVVSDGHYGHESSHDFVELLSYEYEDHGPLLDPLKALESVHAAAEARECPSRSTLIVATIDRVEGVLRGFSIGDSAVFVGGLEGGLRRVVPATTQYAAPWDVTTLGVPPSSRFDIPLSEGMWVISCTDGVTECHYGSAETSIQTTDIEDLVIRSSGSPEELVDGLSHLALTGVRGQPGGEDNVAVVATVV